jgi:hypothetical protein|tara:strand:+ start:2793 stop:3119 length:327 start_codon:yes stop_codon:yes gene_type:complete
MKFFTYETIFLLAHGDPTKMLDYYRDSTEGINFIVNPNALVKAFWVSDRHKAEYLGLCALRSYEDYLSNKQVDVCLSLVPEWVSLEVVKSNPLATLTNTKIILNKENI